MKIILMKLGCLMFCLAFCVSCSSLATTGQQTSANEITVQPVTVAAVDDETRLNWWSVRFRNDLPEGVETFWTADLMAADLVIEPVLEKFAGSLALWRFHRRAVHDAGGHQFSFIFYADRPTAEAVFAMVEESDALALLIQHNIFQEMVHDDSALADRPETGDTSDKSWSPALQRVWPAYIMGASVLWLGLINEYVEPMDIAITDFADLLQNYEAADEMLARTWRQEGQHAFLHHLNALFGYSPMLLRGEINF